MDGVGEVDTGWLTDNIMCLVGDGESTLFWVDPLIEGKPLCEKYVRLFELAENKLDTVDSMFARGCGVNGEAWKWHQRLFAWEEELLGECIVLLSNFSFQVDRVDKWIWKLYATNCYTVSSPYYFLT